MHAALQFHSVHGEHIKLAKNNFVAKRVESFCKGICFSNRTIRIREKIFVRLLVKSIQWTGFLRLGVTNCDPGTHRASNSLPRHACPDLTCRPGYWAKCVPENCFDLDNKLTYFYVDEHGELFLNTPNGEMSLLTGIMVNEPLWALLDIYGNCVSIELCNFSDAQTVAPSIPTIQTEYFSDQATDLQPVAFFEQRSSSLSFPTVDGYNPRSVVAFDRSQNEAIIFLSEKIKVGMGLLLKILPHSKATGGNTRLTTNSSYERTESASSIISIGLTNSDIKALIDHNKLPLSIDEINKQSEFWIIESFKPISRATFDTGDELFFVLNNDAVLQYSQNASKFQDLIHIDPSLKYYPFLVFRDRPSIIALLGCSKSIQKAKTVNPRLEPSPNAEVNECSVCMDRFKDTVMIPCGHISTCYSCAEELFHRSKSCPICRLPVTQINKIFFA